MFRLPNDTYQYKRSFSAHFQLNKKSNSSKKNYTPTNKSLHNFKESMNYKKKDMKSLYLKNIMKTKKRHDMQQNKLICTPSAYALMQKKIIPPCSKNYQYCISENDLSNFFNKSQLIQPSKYLQSTLMSRPITPRSSCQSEIKSYRYLRTPDQSPIKKSPRKSLRKSINKNKMNDILIGPWFISEESAVYSHLKK